MSINLELKDYCQECPDFEADVDSRVIRRNDYSIFSCTHTIYCVHRGKCEAIEQHLRGEHK